MTSLPPLQIVLKIERVVIKYMNYYSLIRPQLSSYHYYNYNSVSHNI